MKHSLKITLILLSMFFIAQVIGIIVVNNYSPQIRTETISNGTIVNITSYDLPYGFEPPKGMSASGNLLSFIFAFTIALIILFSLMKFKIDIILRCWFFLVIVLALGITLNSFIKNLEYSSIISVLIALPLAYFKIFRRNIIIHNATELLIYPGLAAIFVPLLTIPTAIILFIVFSLYDMYAVWHAKFMQKMAKYQINNLKIFSGFFIPYLSRKERELMNKLKSSKSNKDKKIKVSVAILGGGDVVFPIMLSGVVLNSLGFLPAFLIAIGATFSLAFLFYMSKKGKFYPALPFIGIGCLLGLIIGYFI